MPRRPPRAEPAGRRWARQGGFTLLEIIVALAVLGFLMVGITQGVRAGLSLWHAQARHVAETSDLDAAARILRQLLTGMPVPSSDSQSNPGSGITGTQDRFSFVGDLPTGLGTTRRADITIELRGGRLVLLWTPHRHETATGPAPQPKEVELVRGVTALQFGFWGGSGTDQPEAWLAKWDGPAAPVLVRVRLQFAKGDPRHWPDLIAASQM